MLKTLSLTQALCVGLALSAQLATAYGQTTSPSVAPASASQPASAAVRRVNITISRETTYFTGPLNADGTVNYVAALDEYSSRGVTPDNNAAVAIVLALGPSALPGGAESLDKPIGREFLAKLGIQSLPPNGQYFVGLNDYASQVHAENAQRQAYNELEACIAGPWRAAEHPLIAGWLAANEKPLAILSAGMTREKFYRPLVSSHEPPDFIDALLPSPPGLAPRREMSKALLARAMRRLHEADVACAHADLLTIRRLGRHVATDPVLISRLVGVAIDTAASTGDWALAAGGKLSAAQAREFATQLAALPAMPGVAEAIDVGERAMILDAISGIAAGRSKLPGEAPKPAPKDVDWDVVLHAVNPWYDLMVQQAAEPGYHRRQELARQFEERSQAWQKELEDRGRRRGRLLARVALSGPDGVRRERTRAVADLLLAELLPSFIRAADLQHAAAARRELAILAYGLAAHKAERGEYPAELAALAPEYVKAIPQDRFAEAPLVYRRTDSGGYVLYSVGIDGKDEGGNDPAAGGLGEHDDIVVKVKP